jgi:hypothetical protein
MIKDSFKLTGRLVIEVRGPDGQLKDRRDIKNLVVTAGKNFAASRLVGVTDAVMSHMGIGQGTTAAALADTALESQLVRVGLSSGTAAANVATYVATFGPGVGTGAVTEAGIFNAAVAATMLARTVFAVVNKGALDTMSINWQITAG